MDVSTQTIDPIERKNFSMQTGGCGEWEVREKEEGSKEVERFPAGYKKIGKGRSIKQATASQTAAPKNKGTQVFLWRLVPIEIGEGKRSDPNRLKDFIKESRFRQIVEEFRLPTLLSPIRDEPGEENFKVPLTTGEWASTRKKKAMEEREIELRKRRREAEKRERQKYREEMANINEWREWKPEEFYWKEREGSEE
ncbi:uncharacterized protein [Venturia canescens]|uniref:uncharacterized protein n=1 Tax=Venturia canescens TaxID=32260 RepID=UPI001C9CF9CF|nr:uncharacterized protein LOC122418262 [Venturia canescens]